MAKSGQEQYKSDASNDEEGNEREQGAGFDLLRAKYKELYEIFDTKIDQLDEVIMNTDINDPSLVNIVRKKKALSKAQKMLSLSLAVKAHNDQRQQQQRELLVKSQQINKLRKDKEKKEEEMKEKLQNIGEVNVTDVFFLPGKWLEQYKENKIKDVNALAEKISSLDKKVQSELSRLSPQEREKIERLQESSPREIIGQKNEKIKQSEKSKPTVKAVQNVKKGLSAKSKKDLKKNQIEKSKRAVKNVQNIKSDSNAKGKQNQKQKIKPGTGEKQIDSMAKKLLKKPEVTTGANELKPTELPEKIKQQQEKVKEQEKAKEHDIRNVRIRKMGEDS